MQNGSSSAVLFKRRDIILLLFWVAAAAFFLTIALTGMDRSFTGARLEIVVGREVTASYPLNEDRVIRISDGNTCEIKDGRVRMISADCPDKLCVHSREISSKGESIVCLPNHVVLRITGGDENGEVDSIAG